MTLRSSISSKTVAAAVACGLLVPTVAAPVASASTSQPTITWGGRDGINIKAGETKSFTPVTSDKNISCNFDEILSPPSHPLGLRSTVGVIMPDCTVNMLPGKFIEGFYGNFRAQVTLSDYSVKEYVIPIRVRALSKEELDKALAPPTPKKPAPKPRTCDESKYGGKDDNMAKRSRPGYTHKLHVRIGETASTTLTGIPQGVKVEVDDSLAKFSSWATIKGNTLVVSPRRDSPLPGKSGSKDIFTTMFGPHIMLRLLFPDCSARGLAVPITIDGVDTAPAKPVAKFNTKYNPSYKTINVTEGSSTRAYLSSRVDHVKSFAFDKQPGSWARVNKDGSVSLTRVPAGTHKIVVRVNYTDGSYDKATLVVNAKSKPVAKPTTSKVTPPVHKPSVTKPKPVAKPTTSKPVTKPTTSKVTPAVHKPSVTKPKPVVKPTTSKPVVKPTTSKPVVKPTTSKVAPPAHKPVTSRPKPVVKPTTLKVTPSHTVKVTTTLAPRPAVIPVTHTVTPTRSSPKPTASVVQPTVTQPVLRQNQIYKPYASPVKLEMGKTIVVPIKNIPADAVLRGSYPKYDWVRFSGHNVILTPHDGDSLPGDGTGLGFVSDLVLPYVGSRIPVSVVYNDNTVNTAFIPVTIVNDKSDAVVSKTPSEPTELVGNPSDLGMTPLGPSLVGNGSVFDESEVAPTVEPTPIRQAEPTPTGTATLPEGDPQNTDYNDDPKTEDGLTPIISAIGVGSVIAILGALVAFIQSMGLPGLPPLPRI